MQKLNVILLTYCWFSTYYALFKLMFTIHITSFEIFLNTCIYLERSHIKNDANQSRANDSLQSEVCGTCELCTPQLLFWTFTISILTLIILNLSLFMFFNCDYS